MSLQLWRLGWTITFDVYVYIISPQCSLIDLQTFANTLVSFYQLFAANLLILGDFNISESYIVLEVHHSLTGIILS